MADPRKRLPFPKSIAELLAGSFKGKPLAQRLSETEIWRVWDGVVGKQIAAKARPSRLQDGVLTVIVSSAPWMQQLNFLKGDFVERLNAAVGKELVREIYLKAGRVTPAAPDSAKAGPATKRLTAAEMEKINAATASLKDPAMRRAFADLMARFSSTGDGE